MIPSLQQQYALAHRMLYGEPKPAIPENLLPYFGPRRFPGTTSIGYRQTHPEIFQDTLDATLETFDVWLERAVMRTASAIAKAEAGCQRRSPAKTTPLPQMVEKVARILSFKTTEGGTLADAIPQQVYEDTLVRIISHIRHPDGNSSEPHMYREFNALCHRIGLALLDELGKADAYSSKARDIARLIHVSVLSGHIGINLKSSASAASFLLNRDLVPLPSKWIETPAAVRNVTAADLGCVVRRVLDIAGRPEGRFGLDSLNDYHAEVVDADVPTLLVFFCDDYLESLIDLKRFEVILKRNPNLQVLFIPRAGRYGNDLAYADVKTILQESSFRAMQELVQTERLLLSAHGPRAGCIDPRDVCANLTHQIDLLGQNRRIIFETKGCRNFEMLRGQLPVPWYASFNCNRALSIRTVGVDGPPVFLRIPPGLNAYDGFTRPRIGHSRSYPNSGVRFARMTTTDLLAALNRPFYHDMRERIGDEFELNTALTNVSQEQGVTVAEMIDRLANRKDAQTIFLSAKDKLVLEKSSFAI
ncbi:MAG: hypothetical protein PVF29_14855 [Desulfobacterales bacterium]|jgi:hypothetical protein